MRIPPSVIVMSLATAVPFGLAARDTLQHRSGKIDEAARALAEGAQRAKEFEAQELREERARAELEARRNARVGELFGTTPATLGQVFDGVTLGAPVPEAARTRLAAFANDLGVEIRYDGATTLTELHIHSNDQSLCTAISARLDAWPDGSEVSGENAIIWLDPGLHQRVLAEIFDARRTVQNSCSIEVAPYVPVEQWFDRTTSSTVPVWAIGAPRARLEAWLGGRGAGDADSITWTTPGPGASLGATRLVAEIEAGRVIAVTAAVMPNALGIAMAERTRDEIIKQVESMLGPATPDADAIDTWTWAGRLPVRFALADGQGAWLRVGRTPTVTSASGTLTR